MVNLKLVKDNTGKDIPEQPIITYELVADFGEDGTKTVYETSSLAEIYVVIDEIKMGELDRPNLELTTNELKSVITLSILIQLTASYLAITNYGDEMRAEAVLKQYKLVEDETPNIVTGLCPRSWDNTDVSPLSRVQINGILDNCGKCQRYYQCNKVAELNDKLAELDESEGK